MQTLSILYDGECGLCEGFRHWLSRQPTHLAIEFVPLQSPGLEQRFPGIGRFEPEREIVVVNDRGEVYQGPKAWVLCLWATREYRVLSHKLASERMLPQVRKICTLISVNRLQLSRLLGLEPAVIEARVLERWTPQLQCHEDSADALP